MAYQKITEEMRQQIIEMINSREYTYAEIAERFGISVYPLYLIKKEMKNGQKVLTHNYPQWLLDEWDAVTSDLKKKLEKQKSEKESI